MADKYLIGAPVQGQNKPTPLREGDNILNAHLLVGEAGQVAPNIYIVRDEKYVRYDTLTEAKNDAVAGETIVVSRGTYNEQDLLKDQVNWHFEKGVVLQNDTPNPIFTDQNLGPITCNITGKVDIELTKEFEGPNLDLYKMFWVGVEESTINISLGELLVSSDIKPPPLQAYLILTKGTYKVVTEYCYGIVRDNGSLFEDVTEGPFTLHYRITNSYTLSDVEDTGTVVIQALGFEPINCTFNYSGYIGSVVTTSSPPITLEIYDSKIRAQTDVLSVHNENSQIIISNSILSGGINTAGDLRLDNSIINRVNSLGGHTINQVGNPTSSPQLFMYTFIVNGSIDPNFEVFSRVNPIVTSLQEDEYLEAYGPQGKKYILPENVTPDELSPISIEGPNHIILNRSITPGNIQDAYDRLTNDARSTLLIGPANIGGQANTININKNAQGPRYYRTLSTISGERYVTGARLNVTGNYNRIVGFQILNLTVTGENNRFVNCEIGDLDNMPTTEFYNCDIWTHGNYITIDNIKLYNCTLLNGEFPEPINGGALINCIDGNGNLITAFSDD